MANRHKLHINKLEDFTNWLVNDGWEIEEPKGMYEILRARKTDRRNPLIVYKKDNAKEHLNFMDKDAGVVGAYLKEKKVKKTDETKNYEANALQESKKIKLLDESVEIEEEYESHTDKCISYTEEINNFESFISCLTAKLKKQQEKYEHGGEDDYLDGKYDAVDKDIEIINQLVEKYNETRISLQAYEQVMWERNIAIAQLKELGYELGEKIREEDK